MKYVGKERIRELLPQADGPVFDAEVFAQTGVFIIRNALPMADVAVWQDAWSDFYEGSLSSGRTVSKFNPVAVSEAPPPALEYVHRHPALLDVVEKAFGPDIGLFNQRFVIKDKFSRDPVFLHNDFGYHLGWPNKASAFVALSEVTPENGALTFFPGTHAFGYMGDVGEINGDWLDADWPTFTPSLQPGDFVLMNSMTWHYSSPHKGGADRILGDIIYQPASDPSSIALLRGQWQTEVFMTGISRDRFFTRSRGIMLQDQQKTIDALEAKITASDDVARRARG
jgi:hypothetical protein